MIRLFCNCLFFLLMMPFTILAQSDFTIIHGGIIRGDQTSKKMALIFSADEYAEGLGFIDSTLSASGAKGSFFFTGRFFKNKNYRKTVRSLLKNGNYVSTHSYGHLLYCDWSRRDSLLVTRKEFESDLKKGFSQLKKYFGIQRNEVRYFLPPYEWYNDTISAWAAAMGLQIVNFTPGSSSNADYTTPDMGKRYLSSDTIFNRVLKFETNSRNGTNGSILLIHAGAGPLRIDKFFLRLPELIAILKEKGYILVRIDELLNRN
ncbi:MAG: polysaccharide deacetylase family protein [Chitinophagaceae bacterium]|nr:polysaccharide deacetylase family protein [Chitinophagaceae bacterium]